MSSGQDILPRAVSTVTGLCTLFCATLPGVRAQSPSANVAIALGTDQMLAAAQRADESVTYIFEAVAGRSFLIEVAQDGLDFVVRVEDPRGHSRVYDSPLLRDGREFVLVENAIDGTYSVTIESHERTEAVGRHEIVVRELGVAPSTPTRVLDGWRQLSAAAALNAEADTYSDEHKTLLRRASLDLYDSAQTTWRETRNERLLAQALFGAAFLEYSVEYAYSASRSLAYEAGSIYLALNDVAAYAGTLVLQALSLTEIMLGSDTSAATEHLDQILRLLEEARQIYAARDDPYGQGRADLYMGLAYFNIGELSKASEHWRLASTRFESANELRGIADARFSLAVVDIEEGYQSRAVSLLEGVRRQIKNWDDPESQALRGRVLDNLAAAHRRLGNIDEALSAYSEALEVHVSLGDLHGAADSRSGLAGTYFVAGEMELASRYAQGALSDAAASNNARVRTLGQTILGNVAYSTLRYEQALEFHQRALSSSPEEGALSAHHHVLISNDYLELGEHDLGRDAAEKALALADDARSQLASADARFALGRSYLSLGELDLAAETLNEALSRYDHLGLRNERALVLSELVETAETRGQYDVAIAHGRELLRSVDGLRSTVTAPELRAFFSARQRPYYERQISLLMEAANRSGDLKESAVEALEVSERARARMTLDLLTEASAAPVASVGRDSITERARLLEELEARRHRRDSLLSEDTSDPDARERDLEAVLRDMAYLEGQLFVLETTLRNNESESAGLVNAEPLTGDQIREQLDNDSVLLQYSLGDDESFAFVVTRDTVRAVPLASRETIEAIAKSFHEGIGSPRGTRRRLEDLASLSKHVISPILDFIHGREVVVIAADGALQYVPFAALTDERTGRRLASSHQIVNTPSMSTLRAQRSRAPMSNVDRTLLVFADPVFDERDSRLPKDRLRSLPGRCIDPPCSPGVGGLTRLLATEAEARAIANLDTTKTSKVIRGFDANRNAVLTEDLSQYRYVHFATHGLLDSQYPALSGLVFSQFREDGSRQDGVVRVPDVYQLSFNAELVVLSGCETALGEEIRGEGLIGLTQAFLYAGARSVVASLWQVSDAATAEFMAEFYRFMLRGGQTPAHALQSAQASMAASTRYQDPYFWSGFVLFGDWR